MDRRAVIVAGLGVFGAELIISIWYPVPIYIACAASGLILLVAALIPVWWRSRRPWATFLVDERDGSFRTPMYASNVLLGLSCLQLAGLSLAFSREAWVGLAAGLLLSGILAGMWRALWRGAGLTLRPTGIEADKMAGVLLIPWEAVAPERPVRGDELWKLKLPYARPELVTSTGWTLERDEVVFEDGNPDFVATVIATYAAEPDRRHAIGTRAELERLQAGVPAQRRPRARELVKPAPTGTTVRRVIVGLALIAGSTAVEATVTDRQSWPYLLARLFGGIGAGQIYWAVAGWRAGRRARRAAAEPAPGPTTGHDGGSPPPAPLSPAGPNTKNHA
ncbi:hypothetical protein AB0C02_25285 [Micromonospora sp. NPDC048999]|uniref:hypothetical protein n=1 Tax=Micromonospora sp. NPDC048999 TaxID=3155391 RepID=UPI0033D0918C